MPSLRGHFISSIHQKPLISKISTYVSGLLIVTYCLLSTDIVYSKEELKIKNIGEHSPGVLYGFLPLEELPDGINIVPPAPALDSVAHSHDIAMNKEILKLKNSMTWDMAIVDSDLRFPHAAGAFACSLGTEISEVETPNLYMLLRRTATDAGLSTFMAKRKYQRARPFMVTKESTCTPDKEDYLSKGESYPSGHSAIGWTWALVLSEIAPEKSNLLLKRGRAFAQSRAVCNVHWQSDVLEGMMIGSAAYAKLHSSEEYRQAIDITKAEYRRIKSKALTPQRDCKKESEALMLFR